MTNTIEWLRTRVSWLEGTALPHARMQSHADGFQIGWHAALKRIKDGAALADLRCVVPQPSGWQPIETAPRDGTMINVWLADADQDDAAFYCVRGTRFSAGWSYVNGKFRPIGGLPGIPVSVQPTHWTPVPEGPQ